MLGRGRCGCEPGSERGCEERGCGECGGGVERGGGEPTYSASASCLASSCFDFEEGCHRNAPSLTSPRIAAGAGAGNSGGLDASVPTRLTLPRKRPSSFRFLCSNDLLGARPFSVADSPSERPHGGDGPGDGGWRAAVCSRSSSALVHDRGVELLLASGEVTHVYVRGGAVSGRDGPRLERTLIVAGREACGEV